MRERVRFKEIMAWKVLRYLNQECGLLTGPTGDEERTLDERQPVLDDWNGFGNRVDTLLGMHVEPARKIPAEQLGGGVAEIIARAGRLRCIDDEHRVDFAMRTLKCVLHYLGVRFRQGTYGQLSGSIRSAIESELTYQVLLAEISPSIIPRTADWFRHGEVEFKELSGLKRFQHEHNFRLPLEILDRALGRESA